MQNAHERRFELLSSNPTVCTIFDLGQTVESHSSLLAVWERGLQEKARLHNIVNCQLAKSEDPSEIVRLN